jgi:hypothetical protein
MSRSPFALREGALRRRHLLAAPALLLAGCTPEGARPATGGVGAANWVPEAEEAWASLPEPVRRRLSEDPAFADAPMPGIASYQQPMGSGRALEYRAGRIGPLNWLLQRPTNDGRRLRTGEANLSVGGIGGQQGMGICVYSALTPSMFRTTTGPAPRFVEEPGANLAWWQAVDRTEGGIFPLEAGRRFSAAITAGSSFTTASERFLQPSTVGFDVVRRWRPWEIWRAVVLQELTLGGAGSDIITQPVLMAGDMWELRDLHAEGRGTVRLYSEVLALEWATGRWPAPGMQARPSPFSIHSLVAGGGSASPQPWRLTLTPAGEARHAAAVAALGAYRDAAAARSARLSGAERARSEALFRTAFTLWQEGSFRAAYLGFTQGLEVDPANGIAHFYAGRSAASMFDGANRQLVMGDNPVIAATGHLRRFHMEAAARFAPGTREGMEAASLARG